MNKAVNNRLLLSLVTLTMITGLSTNAVKANDRYIDRARVLNVTPQFERVNSPRQVCQTEYREVMVEPRRSMTGSVIGGIAGGLLGSQIGKGSGRVAAAAIGAGIGAITGDRISSQNQRVSHTRTEPVEVCHTVDDWHREKVGYMVDYEYQGRTYSMMSSTHPGEFIELDVSVAPVGTTVVRSSDIYLTNYDRNPGWGKRHHKDKHHHY